MIKEYVLLDCYDSHFRHFYDVRMAFEVLYALFHSDYHRHLSHLQRLRFHSVNVTFHEAIDQAIES